MKLSIRLTATQARILLLVANVLLALGIPAFAAYNHYLNFQREVNDDAVFHADLTKFKPTDVPPTNRQNPASKMISVAEWLTPKPLEALDPGEEPVGKPIEVATEPPAAGALPVGPLEEDWSYTSYILREDPLDNFVILSKKNVTPQQKKGGGKIVKNNRGRPRPQRKKNVRRGGRRGRAIAKKKTQTISFRVSERKFTDETHELDFFIHEADREKFVYWMPEKPDEKFALKYTSKSAYITNPADGLVPADEKEKEEDDEKKPKLIKRPLDWESRRERDYRLIAQGEKKITGSSFEEDTDGDNDGDNRDHESSASSRGAGPGQRKMTADDRKQLRDAMKDIPKEAKRKILEGLQGSKK